MSQSGAPNRDRAAVHLHQSFGQRQSNAESRCDARARAYLSKRLEDILYLTLCDADAIVAHFYRQHLPAHEGAQLDMARRIGIFTCVLKQIRHYLLKADGVD